MIKHHPNFNVLKEFVAGTLPDSISLVVASHVEMCAECQATVAQLTEQAAQALFEPIETDENNENRLDVESNDDENNNVDETNIDVAINFDAIFAQTQNDESDKNDDMLNLMDLDMISQITANTDLAQTAAPTETMEIEVAGQSFTMPRALHSVVRKEWLGLGKISRARLDFEDGPRHASLLHIAEGGQVPSHTHKGFEITLLLQGSFDDEMGHYSAGDFVWLDGKHTHNPVTQEGCVCLTVSSDALHFTKGVSQLFNPLGKYIY
ncbi:ChrR family anti-sigma-E factor [Vibrio sp. 99-70-13A1]|uniref:ChrR family anti-sigma-E factor n=1 Tax=Vibrio sp. 99-70-13A1 TaxID=2607601 RepID=UPI001493D116|nr:ChrR family anti-sigma-E factor [Vibrio sp. 99-70-13A1]NOH95983.1 transcriptional regulator [Vibrio sp. 99-70-13A1]